MIKVTLSQLNNNHVSQGLQSLTQMKIDPTVAYRADRIVRAAGAAFIESRKFEDTLKKELCNLDEKGNVKYQRLEGLPPNVPFEGVPEFKSEEAAKEFDTKMKQYYDDTVLELKVHQVPFESLQGLTGQQIGALVDIGLVSGVPQEA